MTKVNKNIITLLEHTFKDIDTQVVLRYLRNLKSNKYDYKGIKTVVDEPTIKAPKFNSDLYILNSDWRFMWLPRLIDVDFDKASAEDLVLAYGPIASKWKSIYDIAKAHNFEGKYAEWTLDKIKEKLDKYFPISKEDPDVLLGVQRAKSVYSIPEFAKRFEKFGDIGKTFIDDAIWRLDNFDLLGVDDPKGTVSKYHIPYAGHASAVEGDRGRMTLQRGISSKADAVLNVVEHEAGHISGRHSDIPGFITLHNKKFLPTPKKELDPTNLIDLYWNDPAELITRSKTAVRFANDHNLSFDGLIDLATKRWGDPYNDPRPDIPKIPADIQGLVNRYTPESLSSWWKNFVGAGAVGVTTATTIDTTKQKFGGKLNYLNYLQ